MGFILLIIGIGICIFARRIVIGRMQIEEKDKSEIELLISGAILAVRLAGIITSVVGFIFLLIQ
ncbi:hypothetical protein AN640_06540 [Candidatus Epulonipiscium fishelsonii]|uniref:Uncharacterized protein n=1 Tax=Candidatus Epulonipiscium fishelsonii TaxID=77094 RepID=A0ACC8XHN7_9FIRM|nr:hypothetical protein AN640_06540 [Epulopiscium sp. SCG-D08WGA-EpuloA1]OON96400.1 MAG: hypothetical protein ATN32_00900 [Epulopiscium sp. AS2M-Bin002]